MSRIATILLSLSLLLSLSTSVSAQLKKRASYIPPRKGWHLVELGFRGGAAYSTLSDPLQATFGPALGLDVIYKGQFSMRNSRKESEYQYQAPPSRYFFGPLVGFGVSYASCGGVLGDKPQTITSKTQYGDFPVYETFNMAGRETSARLQMEMPIMLALLLNKVTLNLGVVGVGELIQWQKVSLENPQINKYIPVAKVSHSYSVQDYVNKTMTLRTHLYVGAQLGYEWKLKEKEEKEQENMQRRLGFQVFARYDLFRKDICPADDFYQMNNGKLTLISSYTDYYKSDMHYLDFGIRFYYAFAFKHRISRLGLLPL